MPHRSPPQRPATDVDDADDACFRRAYSYRTSRPVERRPLSDAERIARQQTTYAIAVAFVEAVRTGDEST